VDAIYDTLERMAGEMKEEIYLPSTNVVLRSVAEGEKANVLRHHSEKLALAFGLNNTEPGTLFTFLKTYACPMTAIWKPNSSPRLFSVKLSREMPSASIILRIAFVLVEIIANNQ